MAKKVKFKVYEFLHGWRWAIFQFGKKRGDVVYLDYGEATSKEDAQQGAIRAIRFMFNSCE